MVTWSGMRRLIAGRLRCGTPGLPGRRAFRPAPWRLPPQVRWIGASAFIAGYLDDDLCVILLSNEDGVALEDLEERIAGVFLDN
jgi:hypothetical protein